MRHKFFTPSPAEATGVLALLLAFAASFFQPSLAAIPLAFFLLCCLAAPFFAGFGFFLPVISRGNPGNNQIALTFDDGPSPASTPILLDLLARHKLSATFFVIGEKAAEHPDLIADILAHGHGIGNHSLRHDPILMLRTPKILQDDIHAAQEILQKQGVHPLVFRPPSGISNPRLKETLAQEGLAAVTYSCRAMDGGNRSIDNLADKILRRVRPRDIIMLHDLPPWHDGQADYWRNELNRLFAGLNGRFQVVALKTLIRRPVMAILPPPPAD